MSTYCLTYLKIRFDEDYRDIVALITEMPEIQKKLKQV